jgi:hypothetical protein
VLMIVLPGLTGPDSVPELLGRNISKLPLSTRLMAAPEGDAIQNKVEPKSIKAFLEMRNEKLMFIFRRLFWRKLLVDS